MSDEELTVHVCQFAVADSFATGFLFWTRTRHDALDQSGSLDIRYLRSIIFLLVH